MADLARRKFKVHGRRRDTGKEVDGTAEAVLYESGAFAYGNRTGMEIIWDGNEGGAEHFDTRYEPFSVATWPEWVKIWLQNYVADGLLVEPIEEG